MNELTQNLWERFGFRDNPFDTRALSLSSESRLSVAGAYITRGRNSNASFVLNNFLKIPGGGNIIVEGDPGVGKTTFVNYHRYIWEKLAKEKLLTPSTEISVQEDWNVNIFLISLLGSLLGRLRLDIKESEFKKDTIFSEITALTGILIKEMNSFSGGLNILGTGGNLGKNKSMAIQVGELSQEKLRDYLRVLVQKAKEKGYSGVVFHFNNMELLAKNNIERLKSFFDEIRDCLQEKNIYFIFVGYKGMFQQVITPLQRVRSIFFDNPVFLEPMTKEEVNQVIEKRYKLLAIQGKSFIRPVDQSVIDFLYNTFSGKIRYIMNAITSLITSLPEGVVDTLNVNKAISFLKNITLSQVNLYLTDSELSILLEIIKQKRFTNSSLVKKTGKSKQNIRKYLNRFIALNYIFLTEKKGRNVFYEIDPKLLLLKD